MQVPNQSITVFTGFWIANVVSFYHPHSCRCSGNEAIALGDPVRVLASLSGAMHSLLLSPAKRAQLTALNFVVQALASLHSAGLYGCLHPDTVLLHESVGTAGEWKVVMPPLGCGAFSADTLPPDGDEVLETGFSFVSLIPTLHLCAEADVVSVVLKSRLVLLCAECPLLAYGTCFAVDCGLSAS